MNKNITPYNDKHKTHGYWEVYFTNGNIAYKCYHINDRLNGYEEYTYNKKKIELTFYHMNNIQPYKKGKAHGYWEMYWHGALSFKCFYINDKENGYEEYYFTNNKNIVELRFHL